MRKAELEQALSAVADFAAPDARLEQYRTPAGIAADLLWEADQEGHIQGKHVLDLGCGTGIFSLGARLLGAATVTGIDVDPKALELARRIEGVTFVQAEISEWQPDRPYDTVVMNPPFGAQFKGADRPFYEACRRALKDSGGSAWFLAQPKTERFLGKEAARLGASLEKILTWPYPIKAQFGFHDHAVSTIEVACYEMSFKK